MHSDVEQKVDELSKARAEIRELKIKLNSIQRNFIIVQQSLAQYQMQELQDQAEALQRSGAV